MIVHRSRKSPRCTIKGTNIIIKANDCVLIRHSDFSKRPAVANVEKIDSGNLVGDVNCENVKFHVRWYYRPEDSIGGRLKFHGSKELFLSNRYDTMSGDMIEGKCTVHKIKRYSKLAVVGKNDFFCRFEYDYLSGVFEPDRVDVYCICEMPYNPDELMFWCEGCQDGFHPVCVDMTPEDALKIKHFFCGTCSSKEQIKSQTRSSKQQVSLQISEVTSKFRDIKGINSKEQLDNENIEIEALNVLEVGMKRKRMTDNSSIQVWRRKQTNDDGGVLGADRGPEQAIVSDKLQDKDVDKENLLGGGAANERFLEHQHQDSEGNEQFISHEECAGIGDEAKGIVSRVNENSKTERIKEGNLGASVACEGVDQSGHGVLLLNHVNHNVNVEENGGHADHNAPGLEKNITLHKRKGIAGITTSAGVMVIDATDVTSSSIESGEFWHGFPVGERIADLMREVEKEHPDFFNHVHCASGNRVVQDLGMLAKHLEHFKNNNNQMQELSDDVLQIMWDELQDLKHDGFRLSWAFGNITRARISHRSSKLQHLKKLESELLVKTAEAQNKVVEFSAKLDEAKESLRSSELQVIDVKQEIDEVRADLSIHERSLLNFDAAV